MSKKKLVKKLILVVNLLQKTTGNFITKVSGMIADHLAQIGTLPGLVPTPTALAAKVLALQAKLTNRGLLQDQVNQLTKDIAKDRSEVTNDITDKWATYVEGIIAGDEGVAKSLGYEIKGEGTDSGPSAKLTHPLLNEIDTTVYLQHTVHEVNSLSGSRKLCFDSTRIDLYEIVSNTMPASTAGMTYLGAMKNGKFISHFDVADEGKNVWYIGVYIDKVTGEKLGMSPAAKAIIN